MSHPEIFTPGILLPMAISAPPPRLDVHSVAEMFFNEPHPVGYFLAMFGWTELFGTSLAALRMPSALLGILSIPLIFRVGTLAYDRTVGLIAAVFLTLHGLHIYWSQMARMYVPECFFGLLATWLLLEILVASDSRGLEAGYVAAMFAGFSTEWFFWPLAAGHLLYTLIHYRLAVDRFHRLLYVQVLAMILGAFTLTNAVVTMGVAGSGSPPSWTHLQDYLSFGFLLQADQIALRPNVTFPTWFLIGVAAFSIVLVWRGIRSYPGASNAQEHSATPAKGPLYLAAVGSTVVLAGLALLSLPALRPLVICFFPLAAIAMYFLADAVGPLCASWLASFQNRRAVAALSSLIPILSLFSGRDDLSGVSLSADGSGSSVPRICPVSLDSGCSWSS